MSDQKTRYKVAYMDPNFHHQGWLKMIATTNYDFRVNFIFVITSMFKMTGFGKQFDKKIISIARRQDAN